MSERLAEHLASIARGVIYGLALSALALLSSPRDGGPDDGGRGPDDDGPVPFHPPQQPASSCDGILYDAEGGTHFCSSVGEHWRCMCGVCDETWPNPSWKAVPR